MKRVFLAALAAGSDMPLNVLAWNGLPDAERLRALGVRRFSAGSAISEAMHRFVLAMMREFVATGRVDTGVRAASTYGDVQALMARR